jgi:hypothetical protein
MRRLTRRAVNAERAQRRKDRRRTDPRSYPAE